MQTGIADLQGGQSEMIKRVDRLDYAVFGIPDTDERGLLGEMRAISRKLDQFLTVTVLGMVGTILAGIGIAVSIAMH